MKALQFIASQWARHGTKWLGTAQAIVSSLVLLDGFNTKPWLVANVVLGALTIRRGFTNSKAP